MRLTGQWPALWKLGPLLLVYLGLMLIGAWAAAAAGEATRGQSLTASLATATFSVLIYGIVGVPLLAFFNLPALAVTMLANRRVHRPVARVTTGALVWGVWCLVVLGSFANPDDPIASRAFMTPIWGVLGGLFALSLTRDIQ